jgi:multidrug efflux system membrane fusion protein
LLKEGVVAPQLAEEQQAQAKSDAAAVDTARAALRTAKLNLDYTDIRAPIDARAGAILVNLGNNVRANDVNPLITLNEITPIYVEFPVPEAQLTAIRARSVNGLEVRAFVQGDATPATGKLTFIDNAVDASTGTIKLMGTFQNKDRRLWPGQFVNVQLVLGTEPRATVIPSVAVQSSQQGSYVFVIKADGTATMQPVTVERTYRQLAVVGSGVAPGENVVVDGTYRVIPGNKVNVTKTAPVTARPAELQPRAAVGSAAQPTETK